MHDVPTGVRRYVGFQVERVIWPQMHLTCGDDGLDIAITVPVSLLLLLWRSELHRSLTLSAVDQSEERASNPASWVGTRPQQQEHSLDTIHNTCYALRRQRCWRCWRLKHLPHA